MSDDLVKRLREYRVGCGLHCEAHDAQEPLGECIEAASRIEKLEAALRKIKDLHDQPGPEDEQVIIIRDDMTYFIVCEALGEEP